MLTRCIWWDQYLLVRPLESKIICLHKSVLKCMPNVVKSPQFGWLFVSNFYPKVTSFLHLGLFSNHQDWFQKLTLRRWISSQRIKEKKIHSPCIKQCLKDSSRFINYLIALFPSPRLMLLVRTFQILQNFIETCLSF